MPSPEIPSKVILIAGEPSGDQHAANLARALKKTGKNFQLSGMGLAAMQNAGIRLIESAQGISVVGIVEVLRYYPRIRKKYTHLTRQLQKDPPDLLILIDYPEFNLKLARFAHQLGIKTLFYISPQIWAWRAKRIAKIAQVIDIMVVIFPFEVALYKKTDIQVHCIDHPLVDEARAAGITVAARKASSRTEVRSKQHILLLPGSRSTEIKRLMPILCKTANLMCKQRSHLNFSLLLAPGIDRSWIETILAKYDLQCEILNNDYTTMQQADFAITASGTATLQLALCTTPMLVIYKTSWLTYLLLKWMLKSPYIALPNILAGKPIVQELIQSNANPRTICNSVLTYLDNETLLNDMQSELTDVSSQLGQGNSSGKLADIVCQTLTKSI